MQKSLRDRLKEARMAAGFSQCGAADAIGVHVATIRVIEQGGASKTGPAIDKVEEWIKNRKEGK